VLEELERLHRLGAEKVLVAPVGFVSDHLEILWDLDIEARERAGELGLDLERVELPNDDAAFIQALAGLVEERLAVSGRSSP
jgi:ferrochelatase